MCYAEEPVVVDDGTMCRVPTPTPGPNGLWTSKQPSAAHGPARVEHFREAGGILITAGMREKVANLADEYFKLTGNGLTVTSGYRPPDRQARAMYDKIVREGETKVKNLYRSQTLIDEILKAYRAHKDNPTVAVAEIQKTIEAQVERGSYISNHLRSNAIDVRKATTNLGSLKTAVSKVGGRVVVEGDHYHVELH
ncbi:MAG: hypothetical protein JOZ96_24205 [Acidobacteria bacterium]|nr:hypothetical protein [Acidobacteriota bacterium]